MINHEDVLAKIAVLEKEIKMLNEENEKMAATINGNIEYIKVANGGIEALSQLLEEKKNEEANDNERGEGQDEAEDC